MGYIEGTIVQHVNGHRFVKKDGKMIKEARFILGMRRELEPGDRVFFQDGDRENLDPKNITWAHFNDTPYPRLKKSRVLYVPNQPPLGRAKAKSSRYASLASS